MSFSMVEMEIIRWSEAKKIIPYAKPYTQLMKAVSEMGELCDAELKNDLPGVKDGVGDVFVCLINYCALKGIDPVECMSGAYEEIKDRKGYMTPEGVFVKE